MTVNTAPSPAAERFAASNAVAGRFFDAHADAIALACHAMAERFQRSGRLLVHGEGAQKTDVAHIVVEFMHPVVVGKRALPAIAVPMHGANDAARALGTMARGDDVLLLLRAGQLTVADRELLAMARVSGLLTIALTGAGGEAEGIADHVFAVPIADPCIVQETHEMLYHILWELVHVFFEHRPVIL